MSQRSANRKKIFRFLLGAALALLLGSSLLWAKNGVIHTKDGRVLEGDISEPESSDVVVITIHGVQTTIARGDIDHIDYPQTIEQDYQTRAAQIGKNDVQGHLDLARWLLDRKAYGLAVQEVQAAQKIDPDNSEANTLYATIALQERLAATSRPVLANPLTPSSATQKSTSELRDAPVRKYLSADDINIIRQSEWKQTDNTVHVHFNGDVVKRFLEQTGLDKAEFNKLSDQDKGWQILTQGAPGLYKDVRITNDPAPLAEFHGKIQAMVMNGCATAGCHGGLTVRGKFFLYNPPEGEAPTYTNFYVLSTFNAKAGKLIDRTYPDKSLLLQYALPAAVADIAHPAIAKGTPWKGVFSGRDDPRYIAMNNWLRTSLMAKEPTYNIRFTLLKEPIEIPVTLPSTQPSTQGAADAGPTTAPDADSAPAPAPKSPPPQ